jgi:hypothetical protein
MATSLPIAMLRFDRLTAFGLIAVSLMLVFYALEDRSCWFVLAFAGSCVLGSVYGFLQGAWPFGLVEGIWAVVALRRWYVALRGDAESADGSNSTWRGPPPGDGFAPKPKKPRTPQSTEPSLSGRN